MKREVTRACGHTETVAIYGPYKAREGRLEYEATKLCADCYRKQKAAEQAAAKDEVADVISRLGLPELEGTPKQITWASDIRANRVRQLLDEARAIGKTKEEFVAAYQATVRGAYVRRALSEASAAAWIDSRQLSLKEWARRYHESDVEMVDPIECVLKGGL
jgi:ribosome-binding protein aMBF1 (putative translation factor)